MPAMRGPFIVVKSCHPFNKLVSAFFRVTWCQAVYRILKPKEKGFLARLKEKSHFVVYLFSNSQILLSSYLVSIRFYTGVQVCEMGSKSSRKPALLIKNPHMNEKHEMKVLTEMVTKK